MRIAQDEIFGPVTCVLTYRDVDEAVRIANDIQFGLAASIWTADAARGMKLAERLECGIIWINDHHRIDPALPWGGMKDSGMGRETGLEGYREYTQTKSVIVNLDDPVDWYGTRRCAAELTVGQASAVAEDDNCWPSRTKTQSLLPS